MEFSQLPQWLKFRNPPVGNNCVGWLASTAAYVLGACAGVVAPAPSGNERGSGVCAGGMALAPSRNERDSGV